MFSPEKNSMLPARTSSFSMVSLVNSMRPVHTSSFSMVSFVNSAPGAYFVFLNGESYFLIYLSLSSMAAAYMAADCQLVCDYLLNWHL